MSPKSSTPPPRPLSFSMFPQLWGPVSSMLNVLPVDDAESWNFCLLPVSLSPQPNLPLTLSSWLRVTCQTRNLGFLQCLGLPRNHNKYWLLLWLLRGYRGFGQELRNWPFGHWPRPRRNLWHSGPNEAAIFPHFVAAFLVGANLLINCGTM